MNWYHKRGERLVDEASKNTKEESLSNSMSRISFALQLDCFCFSRKTGGLELHICCHSRYED